MRNDVVFIVLTLAAKRQPDSDIISAVYERVGVSIDSSDVETILNVNEWMEAA